MFKNSVQKLVISASAVVVLFTTLFITPVNAQFNTGDGIGICDFIGPLCGAIGLDDSGDSAGNVFAFARNRIALVISLIFVTIILISIFVIIRAAIKYIQSQGEDKEIQAAQKAIKSVFMGIAALFVGVIGIVIVLLFFSGTGLLNAGGDGGDGCVLDQATGELKCEGSN